jgi:PIN domain nuclease of toxin-antitoxin system
MDTTENEYSKNQANQTQYTFYDFEVVDNHVIMSVLPPKADKPFTLLNPYDIREYIRARPNIKLVGFNNFAYDSYILQAVLDNKSINEIQQISDSIINTPKGKYPTYPKHEDELDVSQDYHGSLKQAEAEMGYAPVYDDLDEYNDNLVKYNQYDTYMTYLLFNHRQAYFTSRQSLISLIPAEQQDEYDKYRGQFSLIAKILGDLPKLPAPIHLFDTPPNEDDFFAETYDKTINIGGLDVQFGMGGAHGALKKYTSKTEDTKLIYLDVSSQYPSIIVKLNLAGATYKQIYERRLYLKQRIETNTATLEEIQLSDALKLVLNGTNGNFYSEYSNLYDKNKYISVVKNGQAYIYWLATKAVQLGYKLIQVNTDGILLEQIGAADKNQEELISYANQLGLPVTPQYWQWILQRDVNNYVARTHAKLKTKGFKHNAVDNQLIEIITATMENSLVKPLQSRAQVNTIFKTTSKFEFSLGGRTLLVYPSTSGQPIYKTNLATNAQVKIAGSFDFNYAIANRYQGEQETQYPDYDSQAVMKQAEYEYQTKWK